MVEARELLLLLDNIALPKCSLHCEITCVIPKVAQHLLSFSLSLDPAGQHLYLLALGGGHDEVGVGGTLGSLTAQDVWKPEQ